MHFAFDVVGSPDGPSVHGRIDIGEIPFVGGDLTVGMEIPFAGEDVELFLCKLNVNHGERDAVERRIPSSEEGIFPFVGLQSELWRWGMEMGNGAGKYHGEDIVDIHMIPSLITNILATARRSRALLISLNPTFVDEVIILFTPQHSRKSLTLNIPHIIREGKICKSPIERIGLRFPLGNHIIKFRLIEIAANFVCQFESNDSTLSGGNVLEIVPCSAFGAKAFGVDGVDSRLNDTFVESIFDVLTFVFSSPKFREVRLILREKHLQSELPRWGEGEFTVG
jgi:hypothetical protein